jgi:hypothetical protein
MLASRIYGEFLSYLNSPISPQQPKSTSFNIINVELGGMQMMERQ